MQRGEARPGGRVLGVELDGALEQRAGLVHVRLLHGVHALAAAQETFVGLDGGGLAAHGAPLARVDSAPPRSSVGHLFGDLVLHREHVGRPSRSNFSDHL